MTLLDMQDMETRRGGDEDCGANSSLSLLCHSSQSITVCL